MVSSWELEATGAAVGVIPVATGCEEDEKLGGSIVGAPALGLATGVRVKVNSSAVLAEACAEL